MYWKYHLEAGDAVEVQYDDQIGWGTVVGIRLPKPAEEIETTDDIDLSETEVVVDSGGNEIVVVADDIRDRVPKGDRKTDIPRLSEQFRCITGNPIDVDK